VAPRLVVPSNESRSLDVAQAVELAVRVTETRQAAGLQHIRMRLRLPILLIGLAIHLLFGVAALAQQKPASAATSTGQAPPLYLDWQALKCPPTPICTITRNGTLPPVIFCNGQPAETLPITKPCVEFGRARTTNDIREINLDGLKQIIQRDPKDPRPLLINFWATWCDPCREEFPDLVKVDTDYRSKGLNFVAVSLDDISDIKTAVPKFLNEMKANMPVVLLNVNDPEPAIKAVDATWDGQLPATFLYDKEGKVVFKHFGRIETAALRAAIDKAVGNKP
jgi:thiol-disulfide isomerase/thioredoxin